MEHEHGRRFIVLGHQYGHRDKYRAVVVYLFIYFRHTKCTKKERKKCTIERSGEEALETTGLIRRKVSSTTTHDGYTYAQL